MNTRRKGSTIIRKAITQLENDGFRVARIERIGKFIKDKDAFGIGDLLAVQRGYPPLLVQVTSNKPHNHKLYKEFSSVFFPHIQVIQMVWIDREGFTHYIYDGEGKVSKVKYK